MPATSAGMTSHQLRPLILDGGGTTRGGQAMQLTGIHHLTAISGETLGEKLALPPFLEVRR